MSKVKPVSQFTGPAAAAGASPENTGKVHGDKAGPRSSQKVNPWVSLDQCDPWPGTAAGDRHTYNIAQAAVHPTGGSSRALCTVSFPGSASTAPPLSYQLGAPKGTPSRHTTIHVHAHRVSRCLHPFLPLWDPRQITAHTGTPGCWPFPYSLAETPPSADPVSLSAFQGTNNTLIHGQKGLFPNTSSPSRR